VNWFKENAFYNYSIFSVFLVHFSIFLVIFRRQTSSSSIRRFYVGREKESLANFSCFSLLSGKLLIKLKKGSFFCCELHVKGNVQIFLVRLVDMLILS